MLQLYPELPGSQEFRPWKSSSFFSLSLSLENSASARLRRSCRSHTSTFTQGLHARTDALFCAFFFSFFMDLLGNTHIKKKKIMADRSRRERRGGRGHNRRGSGLARNARQQTRPDTYRRPVALSAFFFFSPPLSSPPPCLFTSSLLFLFHFLRPASFPPSAGSCPAERGH